MRRGRIPFSLLKFINIIIVFIPFIVCWYGYYEPKTVIVNLKQVSMLLFCLLFIISVC